MVHEARAGVGVWLSPPSLPLAWGGSSSLFHCVTNGCWDEAVSCWGLHTSARENESKKMLRFLIEISN